MKKLLPVVALLVLFAACKSKKEEKKPEETTTTTTTTTTTEAPATTTAVEATPAGTGVPTFSDPEVQKFANDYGAFMAEYKAGMKDPSKLAGLAKNMQEWSAKAQKIGLKLATTPEEAKKWADWALALSKDMMPATPK